MKLQKILKGAVGFVSLFVIVFSFTPKVFAETHISNDVSGDETWNLADSPYVVDNYINVLTGATLHIEPGVIVKFTPYAGLYVLSGGSLQASGSVDNKIYFTSLLDDAVGGDTNGDGATTFPDSYNGGFGIYASDESSPNLSHINLRNTVVRYAYDGLAVCRVQDVSITDSVFEENYYGIEDCGNSHVTLTNTQFRNNYTGISLYQADDQPGSVYVVSKLSVYGSFSYGVINETHGAFQLNNYNTPWYWFMNFFEPEKALAQAYDYTVDFRNTWWGDTSGPMRNDNPSGTGDKVSTNVLLNPWCTEETCTVVQIGASNVLFLPGLESSRLYKQRAIIGEDQLWEPNTNSDAEYLYLNTDGTSKNTNIYTRDIIKESNTPISTGSLGANIYKSFSETMDELQSTQKINDWQPFAYDWRQSVEDIVNNGTKYEDGQKSLVDTLQSLVTSSKNGKVTIIAHSNGGLLAKALLKKLQDDKDAGSNNLIDSVDKLILVAVPEIGTAKAVPAILHGYDQELLGGWILDVITGRELGRNMLGAYGLLPSKEYINRVSASPITFTNSELSKNLFQTFGSAIDSYAEYKNFLFGGEGRTNPSPSLINLPIILSPTLFSKAENLHNSIDAFIPPLNLQVIEIAGWGKDTLASFEYDTKNITCPEQGFSCNPNNLALDQTPRFTVDGDGTVVVPSAQYMGNSNNAQKYWLNLENLSNNHSSILEVSYLLNFISDTIQELPTNNFPYLSTSMPIDTKNRFRISIHSPVTIDAYDNAGNHTGKVCPPNSDFCYKEENIPNSSYLEFGEGKYVNLPEEDFKTIKLQGTDVGTFTYDSEKVAPDGTSVVSSFVDIPVTTQTQAEITLNPTTQIPQLKLDVTGDGVADFTVAPNANFDPVAYLQIMKATIDSLDLTKDQKKNFDKRIDDLIKLIQKGKINKAKLQADKFKSFLQKKLSKGDERHPKIKKISKTDAQLLLDILNKLLDNLS